MTATLTSRLTIRQLAPAELGALESCAREFYAAAVRHWSGAFDLGRFCDFWTRLIRSEMGVVFAAFEDGAVAGTIGGMVHPEPYGARFIAEEFFWFARPEHRGAGVALYRRFEEWARQKGASEIHMVHLVNSMPDKVARFYLRHGFEPVEIRYRKAL